MPRDGHQTVDTESPVSPGKCENHSGHREGNNKDQALGARGGVPAKHKYFLSNNSK